MRKIIYHVATSLDNFIAYPDGTTSGFEKNGLGTGDHVEEYLESLKEYDTVIMGRSTYEFGFQFGLVPGKAPYTHMENYVFSKTLDYPEKDESLHIISSNELQVIKDLKSKSGTDIYLCGGGEFAGFLLENRLIDNLLIKLNPVIFGEGIKLFGSSTNEAILDLLKSKAYDNGVILSQYRLRY